MLHSSDGCVHAAKYIEVVLGEDALDIIDEAFSISETVPMRLRQK